jgi:hypothetical protein
MVEFPPVQGLEGTYQIDRVSDREFKLTGNGEPAIEGAEVTLWE